MADVAVTNTFTNGVASDAAAVNTNFTDVTSWVNTNAIRKDATVAFTGVPSGPSTDPTTANQFTRKQYVDDRNPVHVTISPGNDTMGTAIATPTTGSVTIVDPGYDIYVWGSAMLLTSPVTTSDLANVWELSIDIDTVVVGSFIIPVVQNTQSLACFTPRVVHTTGTNCVIRMRTARISGAQASLSVFASTNRSFGSFWYKRK